MQCKLKPRLNSMNSVGPYFLYTFIRLETLGTHEIGNVRDGARNKLKGNIDSESIC